MHRTRRSLFIALFIILVLSQAKTMAQSFSYVYIQGDKQTPFYVKMEDEMQPRYGKNYSIISQLAPGIIHVQILFQQNVYPPQKFTIRVPENGYRGFILTHKADNFSLFDIQQHFYLPAGNNESDDHAPETGPDAGFIAGGKKIDTPVRSAASTPKETIRRIMHNNRKPVKSTVATHINTEQTNQPQFIDNLELNNTRTVQSENETPVDTTNISSLNKAGIVNSDCPNPVSNEEFDDIYKKTLKRSDNTRLRFLIDRLDNCFTTSQVQTLTRCLNNDPERYEFLKHAYPRVTDQSNFPKLEELLSTQEWKGYFRLIMPNQQ